MTSRSTHFAETRATTTRVCPARRKRSVSVCGAPVYRSAGHAGLVHVVKFSGGPSSGAMVLSLARRGALRAGRGDVVLFANTTAEHPATYDIAAEVCDELEEKHAIPMDRMPIHRSHRLRRLWR